ncbi:MAG: Fe-S cluster assembly sulfur transfer protein SufU [Chloroflexota bacterium]
MSSNMYREMILDLYENPLNHGELDPHTFSHEEDNPLCGDVVRIDVLLDDDQRIKDIAWSGDGCAISMASASLMTDHVKGMTIDEVMALDGQDAVDLLGVSNLSMGRVKCATLSIKVLKAGASQVTNDQ